MMQLTFAQYCTHLGRSALFYLLLTRRFCLFPFISIHKPEPELARMKGFAVWGAEASRESVAGGGEGHFRVIGREGGILKFGLYYGRMS